MRTSDCPFGPYSAIEALPGRCEQVVENPHWALVEAEVEQICLEFGLTSVTKFHMWVHGGRLTSLCFPDASPAHLRVCHLVMVFLFLFDDALEAKDRNPEAIETLAADFKKCFSASADLQMAHHPLVRLMREVYRSITALGYSESWMKRFRVTLIGFIDMAIRAADRWSEGDELLNFDDYVRERYYDVAVSVVLALVEFTHGYEMSEDSDEHEYLEILRATCTFNIAFVNDVFSYHKEVALAGSLHNAIPILQQQFALSFEQAVAAVVLIAHRCFEDFDAISRIALASAKVRTEVRKYIGGMRNWMIGSLRWSCESKRYRHPESPFPELRPMEIRSGSWSLPAQQIP